MQHRACIITKSRGAPACSVSVQVRYSAHLTAPYSGHSQEKRLLPQLKRGSVKIISAYAKYMYPVPHADDEGIDCPKEERITASANNRRRKNPKRRGRKSTNAPEVFPPAHSFSSTYRLGRVLQICVAAGIKPARSLASHQTSHQKLLDTRSSGQREK